MTTETITIKEIVILDMVEEALYGVMGFEPDEYNEESDFLLDLKMTLEDITDVVEYIEDECKIEISDDTLYGLEKVQDLINWLDTFHIQHIN